MTDEQDLDLKRGSSGPRVKKLQEDLLVLDFNLGALGADGDYGPKTEQAVRKFQQDNNLEITPEWRGIADTFITIPKIEFEAGKKRRAAEEERQRQEIQANAARAQEEMEQQTADAVASGSFGDDVVLEAMYFESAERQKSLDFLRSNNGLNMVHLNPILDASILKKIEEDKNKNNLISDDAYSLFTAPSQPASGSSSDWRDSLDRLSKAAGAESAYGDPATLNDFPSYIDRRTAKIGEMMDFFQQQFDNDVADGKPIYSKSGADFKKIKFKLNRVKDEIREVMHKKNQNLRPLLENFLKGRYQVTLITSPASTLESTVLSIVIFYVEEDTSSEGGKSIKRVILEPDLSFESPFSSDHVVTILNSLDAVYKVANTDLARASNFYNCGLLNVGPDLHPLLDYMAFSNAYNLGFYNKNDELSELDKNKKREGHVEEVSGFKKTVDSTKKAVVDILNTFDTGTTPDVKAKVIGELSKEELLKIWNEAFLDKLLLKICPQTLPRRVLECLLPSDCRDMVKYLGLWRTRDYVENLLVAEQFVNDGSLGITNMLTKWDAMVEERYNFKAVEFTGYGGLKSGTFNANEVYGDGTELSVSLLINTTEEQYKQMENRSAYLMSQEGIFTLRKPKDGWWAVTLLSAEGEEVEYSASSATSAIRGDGLWHQIGFSYNAATSAFKLYIDGIEAEVEVTSGQAFRGPLAIPEQTKIAIASFRTDDSDKAFAGYIDEVVVFPKVHDPSEWVNLAKIDSDVNLNTLGYSDSASAWWRMGDASGDTLQSNGPGGKIVDLRSGIDLTKIQDFTDPRVIVARLFKPEDEDEFIEILASQTDFIEICDQVYEFLLQALDTGFNPDQMKQKIRRLFKIPTFNADPHSSVNAFIKATVINNLLRIFSSMLLSTLEKYLLSCQNWKEMLKALTKGSLAGNPDMQQFLKGNTPLANLLTGITTPEFWAQYLKDNQRFLTDAGSELSQLITLQHKTNPDAADSGNPLFNFPNASETSLGLGFDQVSFQQSPSIGSEMGTFGRATTATTSGAAPGQETIIEIITSVSRQLPPDQILELFSGTASQTTINTVSLIIDEEFPNNTLSEDDVSSIFRNFGAALGVEGLIGQLRAVAQDFNRDAQTPDDFCAPGETNGDRYGQPKTDAEKAEDRAAIQEILDFADELNSQDEGTCPPPIPLSSFESKALRKSINDVYSSVTMAYDNDLILYKLGMLTTSTEYDKIPKVLWKGDTYSREIFDPEEGKFGKIDVEVKKTQINPDFEKMLEQGYIPKKNNGDVDGTRFGGVVKINWNPLSLPWFEDEGFLTEKRPPKSLAPKVEGDKVTESDAELRDIGSSLGPFTDYEESDARVPKMTVKLAGEIADSLAQNKLGFTLSDEDSGARYDSGRLNNQSVRGYINIESKSKTSMLGTTTQIPSDLIQNSLSAITHKNAYGRSLQGEKKVSFAKVGADPFSFEDVAIKFNLSTELQQEIRNRGYDDSAEACDPNTADSETSRAAGTVETDYTPQENVFGLIARQNSPSLNLSEEQLKSEAFNQLYREVLTALLYKVGDSPLLKAVPGTKDNNSEELLGINFLNLETTPRLIDMESFSKQVTDDFTNLINCPEGLTAPPLNEALKASVSRILARICLVDLILRGIVPFSELFFSKRDPVIKAMVIKSLERDINLFADDADGVKAKIVEQYNNLAKSGAFDEPVLEEELFDENWKQAMEKYIEEEFDFVANRVKEIVHGKCLPEPDGSSDGINDEMYKALIKYAKEDSDNLNFVTQAYYLDGTIKESFSLESEKDDIEKIVSSLTFSYSDQNILLSRVEKTPEELISELGLDFDSLECDNSSIYPSRGQTSTAHNHYHLYEIDENGNGRTTEVVGLSLDPNDVQPHVHAVYDYAVVPLLNEEDRAEHIHRLTPTERQSDINTKEISQRITEHLEAQVIETADFKIMFDFCFNLNDAASLVMVYCLMVADNQIMSRAFSGTKKAIIQMYDWLWKEGAAADPCAAQNPATGLQADQMFKDSGDTDLSPEYMLMLLLAPLQTFKGWTRTADPHVFITQTIMDVLRQPIVPIKDECTGIYSWPGTSAIDELSLLYPPASIYTGSLIEPGVAGLVTLTPAIFGGAPFFPPTPFAYIYYGLVSPLLWMFKDVPRLLKILENDPDAQKLIASTGMNIGPITCDDNTQTGAGTTELEEECPDAPAGFQDTIIRSASAVCDD